MSRYKNDVRSAAPAAPRAAPSAWRSNAWRVISPVLASYCAWMMIVALLRQQLGDARLMQIEVLRARRIEERQHAHDALRGVAHRAGENLVGRGDVARHFGDVIDDDGALLQLHPGHQMLLRALQRFRRDIGLAAAGHGQGDVLVGHPQRRQRAAHALEAGLQDELELVGIARPRPDCEDISSIRSQVALAHVEVALARAELRAQRELAPQALERRLHQLPHGLQRPRFGLRAGQARHQADDAEQLDMLAAHREGIDALGRHRGCARCRRTPRYPTARWRWRP